MKVAPLDGPGVRSAIPASPSGRDLQAPLPPGPSNISSARWGKLLVRVGPNETIKRGHAGLAKSGQINTRRFCVRQHTIVAAN